MSLRPHLLAVLTALSLAALIGPAQSAAAATLSAAFEARPHAARVTLQERLAKADLFVGVIDGKWDGATERALLRGADKVAQASNGMVHPDLRRRQGLENFLADLEAGAFDKLLASKSQRGWLTNN